MIRSIRVIALLCFAWLPLHGLMAQQGNWKASYFANGIVKLQWNYNGQQKGEYMGDAVIAKPVSPAFAVGSRPANLPINPIAFPAIAYNAGSISIKYPTTTIQINRAYDSGQQRGFCIAMQPDDYWFGGGERSVPMLRNGQRIPLNNAPHYGYELDADELNYSVPFLLNTNGYGILFDNPSVGFLDFGKATPGQLQAGFESGELNMYIIPGKTPAAIIENYTALTGRQPLPPRWALGNFVSRFGYRSQAQVEDVIARMKADKFPVDAVVIDIFWFGDSIKGTLGNLDWMNATKWPTPTQMMFDFRQQNINTILVTEPFFLQGTKNFKASLPHLATNLQGDPYMLTQFYFGYGGLLDLFKPEARQWFWQFYQQQTDNGAAGWWGDLGEPENHPADVFHNLSSFGISRKVAAREIHNLYGHMWSKMLFENWRKTYPNKRLFYLNRAGFAGSQRYSIFPWTGDVSRSWNGFKAQLPNLQSMSLSGLPFVHSDAGGFSNTPENDEELYVRWLQMAGFTPVFRPHGTAFGDLEPGVNDLPSEPTFKSAPFKKLALDVVQLRYSLLPYIYTLAWEQTSKGSPIIRPMMYRGIADKNVLKATDQYMFGDAFLVAPVLEKGATTRSLYLPKGNWYRWQDASLVSGGQWIKEPVMLAKMPLFVKAGSLIPMWMANEYSSTANYTINTPLTLRFFPGSQAASGYWYDDDGQTPGANAQPNQHQLVTWSSKQQGNKTILTLEAKNWPAGSTRQLILQVPPDNNTAPGLGNATTTVNGKKALLRSNKMVGAWPALPFVFTGKKIEIIFQKP